MKCAKQPDGQNPLRSFCPSGFRYAGDVCQSLRGLSPITRFDLAGCFETQSTVQPQTTNILTNAKELRILGLSGVYNQVLIDGMPLIQGLSCTYGISTMPGSFVENI